MPNSELFILKPAGPGLALGGDNGAQRGTFYESPDQGQDLGMTGCKWMAREALKAAGEAPRGGTDRFHQAVFAHLCSTFHPGCSSWQTPGDFSMGPIPRERRVQRSWVGSIPPCTAIPSCLPRAGTRRGLQRAPCSARVPQTYVFKGSRCRERCLPILSALTAALGALPLFITLEKQEHGVSLHGDAAY